jgi:hypothetical protein
MTDAPAIDAELTRLVNHWNDRRIPPSFVEGMWLIATCKELLERAEEAELLVRRLLDCNVSCINKRCRPRKDARAFLSTIQSADKGEP